MKLILCAVLALAITGCVARVDTCEAAAAAFYFERNKAIDTTAAASAAPSFGIVSGTGEVLQAELTYPPCDGVIGGVLSRFIAFELPGNTNSFSITDSVALRSAKTFMRVVGPMPIYAQPRFVTTGTISGNRLASGRWQVSATLFSPFTGETIQFNEEFSPR